MQVRGRDGLSMPVLGWAKPWVQCHGPLHIVKTGPLLLRSPTKRESQIAAAGASDDEAQRWLGWADASVWPEHLRVKLLAEHADARESPAQPVPSLSGFALLIAIDVERSAVAGQTCIMAIPEGPPQVGGWLVPRYRGRGLGRELFAAALALGHQHLGIEVLRAGAESSNTASRRSLRGAGFEPSHGSPTHQLEDGRTVAACWYEHAAPTSTCGGTTWS